jgi:hypothetical protein
MEVEPQEITIAKGQAAIVTVKIKPITGISLSSVEVVLTGHPVGVSASDISVITESSWEIQVSDTASSGTYELEAQGISRGLNVIPITKKVSFTLIIP